MRPVTRTAAAAAGAAWAVAVGRVVGTGRSDHSAAGRTAAADRGSLTDYILLLPCEPICVVKSRPSDGGIDSVSPGPSSGPFSRIM